LAKAILEGSTASSSDNREFIARASTTRSRLEKNGGRPIVTKPKRIIAEAADLGSIHEEFRARPTKGFRRKLLSSKLENDSSVLIFENSAVEGERARGGTEWKACFQRGMGQSFNRVFLDEVSVPMILRALSAPLDSEDIRRLAASVIRDVRGGVPVLRDGWEEFTGYAKCAEIVPCITAKRLKLPDVALLQSAFTSDMPDLDGFVGPIDLFDGLDAVMASNFCRKEFRPLTTRMVYVPSLTDGGGYSSDLDERVVPYIKACEMPIVTLVSGLLAVEVLRQMHRTSSECAYADSIISAASKTDKWCSS
jgi:hypothetical protein